ncbi:MULTISPECIES: hypothetical protein [Pseudomonas]|uniref:hypothetical protein n=1 Tax=Pseudomonas germanica TaxID=2815720 RepID=UPI002A4E1531|nr:hypothetical protein [Pseudomonas germanica]WPN76930.1 hypothetical protein QMK46_11375 [Pseudomonas germanica]
MTNLLWVAALAGQTQRRQFMLLRAAGRGLIFVNDAAEQRPRPTGGSGGRNPALIDRYQPCVGQFGAALERC